MKRTQLLEAAGTWFLVAIFAPFLILKILAAGVAVGCLWAMFTTAKSNE